MECILSIFCCKCFGGGDEPSPTLSSDTDVVPPAETPSPATDPIRSFWASITPKPERLNCNTLVNIPELELELKLSNNLQRPSFITEYLRISTATETFFGFIDECLKEAESSAKLLFEAAELFERSEPISSVESLRKFKAHGNTLPQIAVKFMSSCEDHVSRVQKFSKLEKKLDQDLENVESWKAVGSIVCCVTIFGLSISSMVLSFIGNPKVAEKVLDHGCKAIERLESQIKFILGQRKSSLKGESYSIGVLLEQAMKELSNIKALKQKTLRTIEQLDSIKTRVHEQVEVCIKSVEENIGGSDEEAKAKMTTAMHEIKTEALYLNKSVQDVNVEVEHYRKELSIAVAIIREEAGK